MTITQVLYSFRSLFSPSGIPDTAHPYYPTSLFVNIVSECHSVRNWKISACCFKGYWHLRLPVGLIRWNLSEKSVWGLPPFLFFSDRSVRVCISSTTVIKQLHEACKTPDSVLRCQYPLKQHHLPKLRYASVGNGISCFNFPAVFLQTVK